MPSTVRSFEDKEFPASDKSLYSNPSKAKQAPNYVPDIKWMRPNEISKNPVLWPTTPPQVEQGALGDCWFLSALSVVANEEDIVENLFRNNPTGFNINPEGKYTLTFYYDQEWVDVTIDDRIPCYSNGVPVYSRAKNKDAFWVPLIEKAYAKLHGKCYAHLEGGLSSQGLANLAGSIGVKTYFEELFKSLCVSERDSEMLTDGELGLLNPADAADYKKFTDWLWKYYSLAGAFGSLFCTGKSDEESGVEEETTNGLLQNHAYSILEFEDIKGHRLVQMRNPWGKGEWNGLWSDKSSIWTPELKEIAEWKDADDGIFFISWEDFLEEFPSIFEQTVPPTKHLKAHLKKLECQNASLRKFFKQEGGIDFLLDQGVPVLTRLSFDLVGDSAGGCMNYPTWRHSPQMLLNGNPKKNVEIMVQVCQKDMRYSGRSDYAASIGFMVVRGPKSTAKIDPKAGQRLVAIPRKEDVIYKSGYHFDRYLTRRLTLPPYDGLYYFVGSMFNNTDSTPIWNMNVMPMSNKAGEVEVYPVQCDYAYHIKDAFRGSNAGGSPRYDTWVNNPQYLVRPYLGNAQINIMMIPGGDYRTATKNIEPRSMGILVMPDEANTGKATKWQSMMNPMPDYALRRELLVHEVQLKQGRYIIMPQTAKPNDCFEYDLVIYSNTPLKLGKRFKELELSAYMRDQSLTLNNLMSFAKGLMQKCRTIREAEQKCKRHFTDYDKDKSGNLNSKEFTAAIREFSGDTLRKADIQRVFDLMDVNGDDCLEFQEFIDALINCCTDD